MRKWKGRGFSRGFWTANLALFGYGLIGEVLRQDNKRLLGDERERER